MPVPMEKEPHHHVLFRNEFIEVIRATLLPGESTLFHTHSHDTAGFDLVTSTTTEQLLGKPEGTPSISHAGEVSADSCADCPITHRVHNVQVGRWRISTWNCFKGPLVRPPRSLPHSG